MLLPVDIAVLLGARLRVGVDWTYSSMAHDMGVSASQVYRAVERARAAGLMGAADREVHAGPLMSVLEHAVRWVFYPELGPLVRGVPTAHSSPALLDLVASGGSVPVVWPSVAGATQGQGLLPLYPAAVGTPVSWPELYEVLTLVDALRMGRRREVDFALQMLKEKLRC